MAGQIQEAGKFDKWLARAVNWKEAIGWLVAGSTLMGGLASQVGELAQYGWAAVAMVAIVLGSVVFFFVMIGMAAWRAYKPRAERSTEDRQRLEQLEAMSSLDHDPNGPPNWSQTTELVESAISARLGQMQFPTVAETFKAADVRAGHLAGLFEKLNEKVAKMADLDRRSDELTRKELDGVNAALELGATATDTLAAAVSEMQRAQAERDKVNQEFKRIVERALENTWEKLERRCEWIDQGFMAILDRENLLKLAAELEAIGDELSAPTISGQPIEDWDAWFMRYQAWRRLLRNWTRIAGEHRQGVEDRVFETTEDDYRGNWKAKDSYFPTRQRSRITGRSESSSATFRQSGTMWSPRSGWPLSSALR